MSPRLRRAVAALCALTTIAAAHLTTAPQPHAAAATADAVPTWGDPAETRILTDLRRAHRSQTARPAVAAVPQTAAVRTVTRAERHRAAVGPRRGDIPLLVGDIAAVIRFALAQVGRPYVFGAAGPSSFDCSGLTRAAYLLLGISLPHQTGALAGYGRAVSRADLRPGDLIFPSSSHVAIYLGNGLMVHASNPRTGVKVSTIYAFAFARRIVG
jgi:cell wall-associated NlpC family hydrolase